jgi:hypothetical protein
MEHDSAQLHMFEELEIDLQQCRSSLAKPELGNISQQLDVYFARHHATDSLTRICEMKETTYDERVAKQFATHYRNDHRVIFVGALSLGDKVTYYTSYRLKGLIYT